MIQTDKLHFSYPQGPHFDFPEIGLQKGESLLLLGASGSGKSTWLQLLSGLRMPESGQVKIDGTNLSSLNKSKLDAFRAEKVGFIFQEHYFIPSLNVWENLVVAFPPSKPFPADKAKKLLKEFGLDSLIHKKTLGLSQGEKQRLSVLRAVLPQPALILADEPSSSLDDDNCNKLITLLKEQSKQAGSCLIVVTHDQRIKDAFERRIER